MQKQVTLLLLIRILRMFMITMPVIVLYWQSHGLGMKDIFVLQVVYSVAVVLFEVPTGYFADKYGHRTSIIIGCITSTIGFFFYWMIPSYVGFILAELTLAVSTSFMSGARDALLFDTLENAKQQSLYTKLQGRQSAFGNISEAAAALLAGVVAWKSGIATVMLLQWVIIAISIPLAFSLVEINNRKHMHAPKLGAIIKRALHENASLRYLNIIAGGISAATLTIVWFAQPQWEQLGVPVLYFGYLWAGLNLVAAFGSTIAHYLERKFKLTVLLGILALSVPVLYLATSYFAYSFIVLAVIPFFWLLRGISGPIIQDYVQRACNPNERATVLSINALSARLVFSICSPFLGWVTDVWSFETAFFASAIIYGSITLLGYLGFALAQRKEKNS